MEQKVNVTEMRARMEAEGDARVRKELEGILRKQARSVLSVEYGRARQGEGRWYARGCAQLQSCKRETRKAALCGVGWEVDLRAAYPTLMLAKAEKIGEQRRQWCELERYVRNVDEQRRKVAGELDISVKRAKRGFSAVMFGMTVGGWLRKEGVSRKTSATMVGFERDVRRARTLLAELEVRETELRDGGEEGGYHLEQSGRTRRREGDEDVED